MIPGAKPRGTLRVEGKQNSLFPVEPVIKCVLLYLPTQNKTIMNGFLHGICRWFKGASPDHVRVESLSRCFPRELVNFSSP